MRTLLFDANGLPIGHTEALQAAAVELARLMNEMPESLYYLGPSDAEWITGNVLERYRITLRRVQQGSAA